MRSSVEAPNPPAQPNGYPDVRREAHPNKHVRRRWQRWTLFLAVLATSAFALVYRMLPRVVDGELPQSEFVAEAISSSGVVQGHTEATVGAQTPGIVTMLLVEEGDRVEKGQILARIQDNVVRQQVEQGRAAVESARAVLAQAAAKPLATELASASARARQARIAVEQARAAQARSRIAVSSAQTAIRQARSLLSRSAAILDQSNSRLELARKTLDRKKMLAEAGAIPLASYDEALAAFNVASAERNAATESVESAKIGVTIAQDSAEAAQEEERSAAVAVRYAQAAADAAVSELGTLRSQPRREIVSLAAGRLNEAQAALSTAKLQAQNTDVAAPFSGTVTAILAHPGSSSVAGILKLVGTSRLETRINLDESDLGKVRVGQKAILSGPGGEIRGKIARIGSQIDSQRGTLEVFVVADATPRWLTPGQTLNVNLLVNERVKRILVPATSVQREGDQTVVYVLKNGRAEARQVRLGHPAGGRVPVLDGLGPRDVVARNAVGLTPNAQVRTRTLGSRRN